MVLGSAMFKVVLDGAIVTAVVGVVVVGGQQNSRKKLKSSV